MGRGERVNVFKVGAGNPTMTVVGGVVGICARADGDVEG